MKAGIISDTHGCLESFKRIYEKFLKDCDFIIHGGDVLYHGPRNKVPEEYDPAGLAEFLNAMDIPIVAASGNCDSEVDQMVLDFPVEATYPHHQPKKRCVQNPPC